MKKRQGLIVIHQPVHVRKHSVDYWDYVRRSKNMQESKLANPDLVEEHTGPEKSEELLAIIAVLDEGGEKILTKRQRRAFQLVVREGKSLREAAKKMHCSYEMVRQFIKSGAVNLRKLTLTKLASDGLSCQEK